LEEASVSDFLILATASGRSELEFGPCGPSLATRLAGRSAVLLTDSTVHSLYPSLFEGRPHIVLPAGESIKTLAVAEDVCRQLLETGLDRSGLLVGIGGGTVSDLAGFVAAIYLRGIACGFVPTTLLAQLDAAIGGKNGVNLGQTKNIIGTIRQPDFVLIDPHFNASLSADNFWSGLGELVKYAIIGGEPLFERVEAYIRQCGASDVPQVASLATAPELTALVKSAVALKADIVAGDEGEHGRRQVLNLGHTLGHALELQEKLPHGLAVLKGLRFALAFSEHKGMLAAATARRLYGLLEATGRELGIRVDKGLLADVLVHDKKKAGSDIHFVCIEGAGRVAPRRLPLAELLGFLEGYTS